MSSAEGKAGADVEVAEAGCSCTPCCGSFLGEVIDVEFVLDKVSCGSAWVGSVSARSALGLLLLQLFLSVTSITTSFVWKKDPSKLKTPEQKQAAKRIEVSNRFFHYLTFGLAVFGLGMAIATCTDDFKCMDVMAQEDSPLTVAECMAERERQGCIEVTQHYCGPNCPECSSEDPTEFCRLMFDCEVGEAGVCTPKHEGESASCGGTCEVCSHRSNESFCLWTSNERVFSSQVSSAVNAYLAGFSAMDLFDGLPQIAGVVLEKSLEKWNIRRCAGLLSTDPRRVAKLVVVLSMANAFRVLYEIDERSTGDDLSGPSLFFFLAFMYPLFWLVDMYYNKSELVLEERSNSGCCCRIMHVGCCGLSLVFIGLLVLVFVRLNSQ
mmetsp:Transcript_7481/g.16076  ORF Transcript_7481/g.16076 Transcript_7481/m.16076 type:complete len:380 (+) Transcript_7481:50-1189(+)